MTLRTDIKEGDPFHDGMHNDERQTINALDDLAGRVPDLAADGVTDDAPALQAALDAGYDVALPARKSIRLASTVTLRNYRRLRGWNTTLKPDAGVTALALHDTNYIREIEISGLFILGGAVAIDVKPTGNAGAYQMLNCTFRNIRCGSQSEAGMNVQAPAYRCEWHNVFISAGVHGLRFMTEGHGSHINLFNLCSFSNLSGVPLLLDSVHFSRFILTHFEANQKTPLVIAGCSRLAFDSTYFEGNGQEMGEDIYPCVDCVGKAMFSAERTWNISFDTTQLSGAGAGQGDPPVFLRVSDPANVTRITLTNHAANGYVVDWGNGTTTQADGALITSDDMRVLGATLRSPNGTRYRVTVADDGTLSAEAVV